MSPTAAKYVVISPVKDEAEYIEATLKSVINQSVRPGMWVIVDDGSRDATPSIVARYAATHSWIKPLTLRGDGRRQPGPPVIHAFNAGYDLVRNCDFDFVVKLDADLDLPSDYFEKLMAQF